MTERMLTANANGYE